MSISFDRALDLFHADMLAIANADAQDMMEEEARDFTPVPREYWGMSIVDVEREIQEYAVEQYIETQARNEIPSRWW